MYLCFSLLSFLMPILFSIFMRCSFLSAVCFVFSIVACFISSSTWNIFSFILVFYFTVFFKQYFGGLLRWDFLSILNQAMILSWEQIYRLTLCVPSWCRIENKMNTKYTQQNKHRVTIATVQWNSVMTMATATTTAAESTAATTLIMVSQNDNITDCDLWITNPIFTLAMFVDT